MNILLKFMLAVTFGGLVFSGGAKAEELKMNTVEFCPKTPYERWSMFSFKYYDINSNYKLNIWPKTIYVQLPGQQGQFPYTVHTTKEGYTYIELVGKPDDPSSYRYMYFRYYDYSIPMGRFIYDVIYLNKACLMKVYQCKDQESVEKVILQKNNLLNDENTIYCSGASMVRHVNRNNWDEFRKRNSGQE
ncbi:MAG: hypothetical protein JKY92_06765 [Magnetovibrio sp.]|nr:hypothetical protein [Magnetovibrio sp.]